MQTSILSQIKAKQEDLAQCRTPQERHKALLDLGEYIIITLEGILFGEYKERAQTIEKIERSFYNCATRAPSLGVHWGFVRDLGKVIEDSILTDALSVNCKSDPVGKAVFTFDKLKDLILNKDRSQRVASGFEHEIGIRFKGHNSSPKPFVNFFDTVFVKCRNVFAHPDQVIKKTGEMVKWPLTEEYFDLINPLLEDALADFIEVLAPLANYANAKIEDAEQADGQRIYRVSVDGQTPLDITVSSERFGFAEDDELVLEVPTKALYVPNIRQVPDVNPDIAKKIVKDEKRKQTVPLLETMIADCLGNDSEIDSSEFFSLKLTAQAGYIEVDDLMRMIGKERQKNGLPTEFDIIESGSEAVAKHRFNPWWMIYFTLKNYIPNSSSVEKGMDNTFGTRTFAHKRLFTEFQQYLEAIVDDTLNKEEGDSWMVKPNSWQQGNLTGTVWSGIFQQRSPFGGAFRITVLLWEDFNIQDRPLDLVIGLGVDRDKVQEVVDALDPEMTLFSEYSEAIKSLIRENAAEFREIEKKYGSFRVCLAPKHSIENSDLAGDFIAKDLPARDFSMTDVLMDMDFYFDHFIVAGMCVPPLLATHLFDEEVDVEKYFKVALNLFAVPIQRVTDYAIENGLTLQKAKEANSRYEQVRDGLMKSAGEIIAETASVERTLNPVQIGELHERLSDLGLRYHDSREVLDAACSEGIAILPEYLRIEELDTAVLDLADAELDTIIPELNSDFQWLKAKSGNREERADLLAKSGLYGASSGLRGLPFQALSLGFCWKRGGARRIVLRLSYHDGQAEDYLVAINRFAASRASRWSLRNEDGSPRYLAERSLGNRGQKQGAANGYLEASFSIIEQERGLESVREDIFQSFKDLECLIGFEA